MPDLITQRLTIEKFLGDIEPKYPEWGTALREQFPDTDLDEVPFLRKGFELEDSDLEMVPGERADIATISTLALDRDREVLLPEGADLRFYLKNPIVPYAHDYWGLPIGRTEWVKVDSRTAPTALIAKTKYASAEANPKAEQVYLLHAEGILRAKSVGFIPIASKGPSDDDWVEVATAWRKRRDAMLGRKTKEADPRRIYTKWVLLEQSPVPVPSNPEALAIAVSKGILTMEEAVATGLVEETPSDPEVITPETKALIKDMFDEWITTWPMRDFDDRIKALEADYTKEEIIEGVENGESPEISDEDAQKILDMVGSRLTPKEEVELTVEELLAFQEGHPV